MWGSDDEPHPQNCTPGRNPRNHVLDIPTCNGSEWDFLKFFGVGQRDVVGHLIEKLLEKQETRQESAEMTSLYQGLAEAATTPDKRQRIRTKSRVHEKPLVYLPPGGESPDGSWVKLQDCVWSTMECLQKTTQLEKIYLSVSSLLREILKIPNAGMASVIAEIAKVSETDTLQYITGLFIVLGLYTMMNEKDVDLIGEALVHLRCFPIVATEAEDEFDSLEGVQGRSLWFIADQPHLRSSFAGRIPLLAFSVNDMKTVMPLLRALQPSIDERKLSKMAKRIPAIRGATTYHAEYTDSLRAKAKFIFSRSRYGIVVEWSVQVSPGTVLQGRADAGKVKVSDESGPLRVYMTKDDLVAPSPPLELGEELCKHCEIAAIRHLLSRRGFSVEDDDFAKALVQNGLGKLESLDLAEVTETTSKEVAEKQVEPPTQNYEALGRFIEGIEEVASMQKVLGRRWEQHKEEELTGILSRVSRESHVDASVLLPRDYIQVLRHQRRKAFDMHTKEYWYSEMPTKTVAEVESRASYMCPSISYTVDGEEVIVNSDLSIHPIDQEALLVAELTISNLFEKSLDPWYSPSKHWTSSRRCVERGEAFPRSDWDHYANNPATFTIMEEDDSFRDLLARFGQRSRKTWQKPTTFHVEVVVSQDEAGSGSRILMNGRLMSSALRNHAQAHTGELTDNVFILIVVSSIFEAPKICIMVNPWESILSGQMGFVTSHPVFLNLADGYPSYDPIFKPRTERLTLDKGKKKPRNSSFWKRSKTPSSTRSTTASTTSLNDIYIYHPLKKTRDIRLLKLEAGRGSDDLAGTIIHASLDELASVEFHALSYRWGPNLKPKSISTPDGRLDITLSLWKALLSIRDADSPKTVWADAICINQADNMEKSIQIRLMSQVFQTASKVYAWLGEEEDDSSHAMQALLRIRTWDLRDTSTDAGSMPATWKAEGVPPKHDKVIPAIKLLLARQYFRRAWIIQELVLAKKVVMACGSWTMSLDDMFEALRICRAKGLFLAEKNTDRGAKTDIYAAYAVTLQKLHGC
ncbi:heterokaryon incompatibility protein-domain-containing protein, partial [Rhypophila decipiens]